MREIMIRDNVNNGEWDTSLLVDWDMDQLVDFGLNFTDSVMKDFEKPDENKEEKNQKSSKKIKKIVTCPECGHEFEL